MITSCLSISDDCRNRWGGQYAILANVQFAHFICGGYLDYDLKRFFIPIASITSKDKGSSFKISLYQRTAQTIELQLQKNLWYLSRSQDPVAC